MMPYDKKIRNSVIAIVVAVAIICITLTASYFAIYGAHSVTFLGNKDKKATAYANASVDAAHGETVFFGDSITEMCNLEEFYPNLNLCNRGISGDTTQDMLDRLESNVLDIAPSKIVFLGGTNDIGRNIPPQDIANNIQLIIQKIQESLPACKIFVQSVYPVNTVRKPTFFSKTGSRTNVVIDELNVLLQNICNQCDCVYIEVNSSLKDEEGNLKNEYTFDGLHLTKDAYIHVASIITPYIV
ncbi:MAG: lysophospholipase [Clostridia bacterium]|nr:lysophospholipase [Clostridia bacterium]